MPGEAVRSRCSEWSVPFHRQRQVDTGDVILKVDRRVGGWGGKLGRKGVGGETWTLTFGKRKGRKRRKRKRGGAGTEDKGAGMNAGVIGT